MSILNKKKLQTEEIVISSKGSGFIKVDKDVNALTCNWDVLGNLHLSAKSTTVVNVDTFYPVGAGYYINIMSINSGDALTKNGDIKSGETLVGGVYKQSLFEKKRWYLIEAVTDLEGNEQSLKFLFQLESDYSNGKRECYSLNNYKILSTSYCNFQFVAEPRGTGGADVNKSLLDCDYIGFYGKLFITGVSSLLPIKSMTIKPLPLFLDIDGYSDLYNIN